MTSIAPDQIQRIKQTDIVSLVAQGTKLHRVARNEYAGPCPSPACDGDTDSLHVHADNWWFCRKCHERRSDIYGYVMHYKDVDFPTAHEYLGGVKLEPFTPAKQPSARPRDDWKTDRWQQHAYELVEQAAQRLDSPAGAAGREYLESRGIEQHTWRAWLLGFTLISPPWSPEQQRRVGGASITIPYCTHNDDRILAVRYRRIDPQADRYINEPSGNGHVLHGLHMVDLNAHTLIITEGEINALSIWQAARDLGISVVSLGSQSTSVDKLKVVSWLSKRFQRCVVWCDEPDTALNVRTAVQSPHVLPLQSPKLDGKKVDANDMLQLGLLRMVLERKLTQTETTPWQR